MAKKVPKRLLRKAEKIIGKMNETGDVDELGKLIDQLDQVNEEMKAWKKKRLA